MADMTSLCCTREAFSEFNGHQGLKMRPQTGILINRKSEVATSDSSIDNK